jgi:catechol 2,3-dioxygenase-like lactoylglutathione lyase family enzyme
VSELARSFEGGLFAVSLVTEDLVASDAFYGSMLGMPKVFGDEVSSVYMAGNTAINLLASSQWDELIAPAKVGSARQGAQTLFTLRVSNVDAVVEELKAKGVAILNGPLDRPWGVRTASFTDPSGHVWEIADHA